MFYICAQHKLAFPNWGKFCFHWGGSHKGQERPEGKTVEREDLPVGYNLFTPKPKTTKLASTLPPLTKEFNTGDEDAPGGQPKKEKPADVKQVTAKPASEKQEDKTPPAFNPNLTELPHEPMPLFETLLWLKDIEPNVIKVLVREFNISKFMWLNPQNIEKLLKSYIPRVTSDWIDTFLQQYANALSEGNKRPGTQFIGPFGESRAMSFGQIQGFPQGDANDPLTRFIQWQMWREDQKEKASVKTETTAVDPAVQEQLNRLEEGFNQVTQLLAGQEAAREKKEKDDALEARFAGIQSLIEKALAPKPQEGESFMKLWMDEREKRMTDIITGQSAMLKDLGEKLAGAVNQVSVAKQDATTQAREAVAAHKAVREELVTEMKAAGFAQKSLDDKDLQREAMQTIVPVLKQGLDKLHGTVEQVVTGKAQLPGGGPGTTNPINLTQAGAISEVMQIEERLRAGTK